MRPTEIMFLIDRSGSMNDHLDETFQGFKRFIDEQRKVEGECGITVSTFASVPDKETYENKVDIQFLTSREPIENAPYLDRNNFRPEGGTPILDAVGVTIDKSRFMISDDENRQVVFVLITDGAENTSKEYDNEQINEMVNYLRRGGWKFVYIQAGNDRLGLDRFGEAALAGESQAIGMGFKEKEYYTSGSSNIPQVIGAVSKAIGDFRTTGQFKGLEWKE